MDSSSGWPAPQTLGPLVRAAQRDGADALNHLLATLRPALVTYFQQRLPQHAAETEDLTQLALIRVARALRRIDPERAEGYVTTVARNLLRTAYRQRARDRRRHLTMRSEPPAETWLPDDHAEYEELVLAVHRAVLTKLPRPLKEIMTRLIEDESQVQIADELHVKGVTVRTRLWRARAILRTELAPYCFGSRQQLNGESSRRRRPQDTAEGLGG